MDAQVDLSIEQMHVLETTLTHRGSPVLEADGFWLSGFESQAVGLAGQRVIFISEIRPKSLPVA